MFFIMFRLVLVKPQTRFSFPLSLFCLLPPSSCLFFFSLYFHPHVFFACPTAALCLSLVPRRGWLRSMSTPNRMSSSCCSDTRQGMMGNIKLTVKRWKKIKTRDQTSVPNDTKHQPMMAFLSNSFLMLFFFFLHILQTRWIYGRKWHKY